MTINMGGRHKAATYSIAAWCRDASYQSLEWHRKKLASKASNNIDSAELHILNMIDVELSSRSKNQ